MGLQVRVRHALGDRLIELADRTIDNPITVGRAAGVEVQVPSVSVAPRHCVLFNYDGHWAVQDVAGTSGTYVNGQQVVDPVMLQIGDVISIGGEASAPTIEVDPGAAAEGRTGWAGDEVIGPASAGGQGYAAGYGAPVTHFPPAVPGMQRGTPRAGGFVGTYPAPAAAPAQADWSGQSHEASGDEIGFGASAAATTENPQYRSPRRRAKAGTPTGAIVGGILAVVAIIIVTVWVVIVRTTPEPVVIVPPPPKPAAQDSGPTRLFEMGTPGPSAPAQAPSTPSSGRPAAGGNPDDTGSPDARASASPSAAPDTQQVATAGPNTGTPAGTGTTPVTPPPTTTPEPATPPPPPAEDWQEMQKLHDSAADPALAIFRLNAFLKQHADQHPDDIKKFMEDKFDSLWWDRIEQLFRKKDQLAADITKKQNEIWDENNPAEKKREQGEKDALIKTLAMTKDILTVKMGYAEEKPPGASGLTAAREKRDVNKYTEWKRTTLNSIVSNKGKTDWEADG